MSQKALAASIRKYKRVVKTLEENIGVPIIKKYYEKYDSFEYYVGRKRLLWGATDCPLCDEYPYCKGCDIFQDTGLTDCYTTPYYTYVKLLFQSTKVTKRLLNAIKKELKYLEKLYQENYKNKKGKRD